jgi:copper transport protein
MIDRRFAPPPSGALRSRRVKRLVVLFAVASLASPAAAFAHATLLRTAPADGAVLAAAPRHVTIFFDDTIRAGKGNAAIANGSKRSVLAGPATAHGHNLVLPLRRLPDGDYSVRWSIVSDDGHPESGVLAFAVGAGRAPPTALLDATTHSSWSGVLERTLFLLGLLTAGGAAVFGFQARPVLGGRLTLPLAQLIFFSLLVAFLGGSALLRAATAGTRYDHVLKVAIVVSIVGGAAAALAPVYPRLLDAASLCALVLLAAPTLGGHALDRDQPRLLSVPADLAHVVGAAIWLGGLITLVTVLPRVRADDSERQLVVRRFSTTAFVAVCVLSAAGLARAVTELHSVSQVWSTSYGRVLIVKSVLLLPLLGLGWLNRTRLLGAFTRLRRSATVEVLLLGCIVVAVAVLVELRPGTAEARRAQPSVASPATATLPSSRTAVVDARGIAGLAVGLARVPGSATVTIIGPDGSAAAGESVAINGDELRQRLLSGGGWGRPGPGARQGSRSDVPHPGDGPGRNGAAARADEEVPGRAYDRLRRIALGDGSRRHPVTLHRGRAESPRVPDPRRVIRNRNRSAPLGPRCCRQAVRRVAPDAARRDRPHLDDVLERPRGRTGRSHVPGPRHSRLVPRDTRRAAAAHPPHDGRGALHDRALRRVRRTRDRVAAVPVTLSLFADVLEEARRVLEGHQPTWRGARAAA